MSSSDESRDLEMAELLREVRALRQTIDELKSSPGFERRLPPNYAVLARTATARDYAVLVRAALPPDYEVAVRTGLNALPPEYAVAVRLQQPEFEGDPAIEE